MENKDQKLIVKETRRNKDEYAIKKAPSKTILGRILIILIVLGTILVPIISAIVTICKK